MSSRKRVIITGASAGIGRALALEYARRGVRLVLAARRAELLDEVRRDATALGSEVRTVAIDVTEPNASRRILAVADEAYGGVDTVIMNAGIGFPAFVDSFSADETEHVMQVNYVSAVRMIEAVLPRMRAADAGQIVAITSLASFRGMPGSGAYNASKAALTVLMESIRTELRTTGVTVTTIFPGFIRTAMTDQNEFRMPFLMEVDVAARRIVRAIERGATDYRFPTSLSALVRVSTYLPNRLYDWIVRRGRTAASR
jgi:short-subunit dehydrogenase